MRRVSLASCQRFKWLGIPPKPRRGMVRIGFTRHHGTCRFKPVDAIGGSVDVDLFRLRAWEPATPIHMRHFHHLPAMTTWFTTSNSPEGPSVSLGNRLLSFSDTVVSYELIISPPHGDESAEACSANPLRGFQAWLRGHAAEEDDRLLGALVSHLLEALKHSQSRFLQFDAPLSLIIQASRYNESTADAPHRMKQLYIAQSDIRNLPAPLGEDLPLPEIVSRVGKGDIYGSSIWLGLQPTLTPLHRDPNPNLFCQLAGSKAVRLLRPAAGLSVFRDMRTRLGGAGSSRFRGPEMMDGPERDELHRAIWADPDASKEIWQAVLGPGEALFIPQGWWHSVRSVGREAELNASANWWFR